VLTASILLPHQHYSSIPSRLQFFEKLLANLQAIAGVQFAGAATDLPWTGYDGNADGFTVEGFSAAVNRKTTARYHVATPDYFRALGIPLLRGRFITMHDGPDSPAVIVINESMANRYWPDNDAIGKRISFRSQPKSDKDWIQVIGVVRDVKDQPDSTSVRPAFWLPHSHQPERALFVAVRSTSDSATIAKQFRAEVRQLDPQLAISDLRLMNRSPTPRSRVNVSPYS